jgi:hypothetical protein
VPGRGDLRLQPLHLRGRTRDGQDAALRVAAVDPLSLESLLDPVEALPGDALGAAHRILTRALGPEVMITRDARRDPAAVAARRTEARHLALQHADAQGRIGLEQRVGGPQTGEARSDDGYVDVHVARKWRARRDLGETVEPEAAVADAALVDHHGVGTLSTLAAAAATAARSWS